MPNKLKQWHQAATTAEREKLAKIAGTTAATLEQMQGAYKTGGVVSLSPEKARALEEASLKFPNLPELRREDLCGACGRCDLAKVARKVGA